MESDESLRFALSLGTRLHAARDGVRVSTPSRSLKVDLGSRAFEEELVAVLGRRADLSALRERYASESIRRALATLTAAGALSPYKPFLQVELLGAELTTTAPTAAERARVEGATLTLLARIGDERLGSFLDAARERRVPVLLAWLAGPEIAIAADDGSSRPCARCALLFDARLPDSAATRPDEAVVRAHAESDPAAVAAIARAALAAMIDAGADRPAPGRAFTLDVSRWAVSWEPYRSHPSCRCTREAGASLVTAGQTASWAELKGRRFAPVVCVATASAARPARVLFRRSRSPFTRRPDDCGIASASAPDAELRALGEGIERFCMLHAPPDRSGLAATELDAPVLDESSIRSLLFRPEERANPGFRLPEYSRELALDWSWATRAQSGERRLVPTCLVGRPSASSARLVDSTSNGYAAHTDRARAIDAALYEVIERDAVLTAWYLGILLPRISGQQSERFGEAEVRCFLATQDVDVPSVVCVARLASGGLRLTAAAAASFDAAWDKAHAEMRSALQTLAKTSARRRDSQLADAARRDGPEDHLWYYLDPVRAAPAFDRWWSGDGEVDAEMLRGRWPAAESGPGTVAALAKAGLDAWIVERSLPDVFGPGWSVVRAVVPDALEISWGHSYRRLASARLTRRLAAGATPNPLPHPFA